MVLHKERGLLEVFRNHGGVALVDMVSGDELGLGLIFEIFFSFNDSMSKHW